MEYDNLKDNETFMEILEYLRCNCIASEDEVVDGTDIDIKDVLKYYSLAQAIVAEEIEKGDINDFEGYAVAKDFMEYLEEE